jgi:hypothetical protein
MMKLCEMVVLEPDKRMMMERILRRKHIAIYDHLYPGAGKDVNRVASNNCCWKMNVILLLLNQHYDPTAIDLAPP